MPATRNVLVGLYPAGSVANVIPLVISRVGVMVP